METLLAALRFEGLPLLVVAVLLAGLVRGFAGFGTAMVFVPLAALVAPPVHAILMMMSFDLLGPLLLLPRAVRDGEPRDVGFLTLGAMIGLPLGVMLLVRLDPVVFRWLVSLLAIAMLVLLTSGWRYRQNLSSLLTSGVGFVGGFLGGVAALPGPPVILSYMSSPRPPHVIRGNTMLYLFAIDLMAFAVFGYKGLLALEPLVIGLLLAVPYGIAGLIGQWIFNPEKEKSYRRVAYVLIAASAIMGLPVVSG